MRAFWAALGWLTVVPWAFSLLSCQPDADERVLLEQLDEETPIPDIDFDGYSVDEGDCDDTDPLRNPGADEGTMQEDGTVVGDGIDNNCDGRVDEGTTSYDDDQDGFSELEGDCDDTNGQIHPDKLDGCDGVDADCDGVLDEDARDAQEPNDSREDAFDLGDVSCTWMVVEFNIHDDGDVDYLKFTILDGSECSLGITVNLPDDDDFDGISERDFYMLLYKEEADGQLNLISSTSSTVGDPVVGTPNGGDTAIGVYYLQIGPASDSGEYNAVGCNDTARVTVYGIQDFTYETPAATRSGRSQRLTDMRELWP